MSKEISKYFSNQCCCVFVLVSVLYVAIQLCHAVISVIIDVHMRYRKGDDRKAFIGLLMVELGFVI
jgi:hypothetical protein